MWSIPYSDYKYTSGWSVIIRQESITGGNSYTTETTYTGARVTYIPNVRRRVNDDSGQPLISEAAILMPYAQLSGWGITPHPKNTFLQYDRRYRVIALQDYHHINYIKCYYMYLKGDEFA